MKNLYRKRIRPMSNEESLLARAFALSSFLNTTGCAVRQRYVTLLTSRRQVREREREKQRMRDVDRAYAEEYKRMTEENERRRREMEDRRRERIGKLEIMGNDKAERERAMQEVLLRKEPWKSVPEKRKGPLLSRWRPLSRR
jgi:hypothetical protein